MFCFKVLTTHQKSDRKLSSRKVTNATAPQHMHRSVKISGNSNEKTSEERTGDSFRKTHDK